MHKHQIISNQICLTLKMIWIGVHTCEATETFLMMDLYRNTVLSRQFMDLGVYQMVFCAFIDRCPDVGFHVQVSGYPVLIWALSEFFIPVWRWSMVISQFSVTAGLASIWWQIHMVCWFMAQPGSLGGCLHGTNGWMEIQWRGIIFHVANWNITML